MDLNYYNVFADAGYSVVMNNTDLQAASDSDRILGIFSVFHNDYMVRGDGCCPQ